MKPVIGVPASRIYNRDRPYSPYVYGVKHTFIQAIERAGGIPLMLPIVEQSETVETTLRLLDGILFADGNDITAEHYGEEPRNVRENDPERDVAELTLMKQAETLGMPILGICRGMQLMNVYRGGNLYQDILVERPDSQNHDGYMVVKSTEHLAHTLELMVDTKLRHILQTDTIKSNTHHHQAIRNLGHNLQVNAVAEDGVIEGIEDSKKVFFIGVQPHPESIFQRAEPQWMKLFQAFIEAAAMKVDVTK